MTPRFSQIAGSSSGRRKVLYCRSRVCTFSKYSRARSTSAGCSRKSSRVRACTLAPAAAPLWAMGVAMAIPLFQLWPAPPAMLDGNRSVAVGATHETSPMSSDPPPRRSLSGMRSAPARVSGASVGRPRSSTPSIFWTARANRWSSSDQSGIPTRRMLANIVSAITRFMCCGQAAPRTRDVTVVPVIFAAPSAIASPIRHIRRMLS